MQRVPVHIPQAGWIDMVTSKQFDNLLRKNGLTRQSFKRDVHAIQNGKKAIHSCIQSNPIKTLFYRKKIEKRYWTLQIGGHIFFMKEERDPKNHELKKSEAAVGESQMKVSGFIIPEVMCKFRGLFNSEIRISEFIPHTPLGVISFTKLRKILPKLACALMKLEKKGLLPTILRTTHFCLTKRDKIILFDNAIGLHPILRNKIALMNFLMKDGKRISLRKSEKKKLLRFLNTQKLSSRIPYRLQHSVNQYRINSVLADLLNRKKDPRWHQLVVSEEKLREKIIPILGN